MKLYLILAKLRGIRKVIKLEYTSLVNLEDKHSFVKSKELEEYFQENVIFNESSIRSEFTDNREWIERSMTYCYKRTYSLNKTEFNYNTIYNIINNNINDAFSIEKDPIPLGTLTLVKG